MCQIPVAPWMDPLTTQGRSLRVLRGYFRGCPLAWVGAGMGPHLRGGCTLLGCERAKLGRWPPVSEPARLSRSYLRCSRRQPRSGTVG
eukprot:8752307-Alexandrium_andersonii.AAC.1